MRKLISFSLFLTILLLALLGRSISQAQTIIVKTVPVTIIKPPCPQHGYRWIEGYYRWNKRTHRQMWVNGYWARPGYHRRVVRVRV